MARKMPRRLVALSSSAITAVYFAGLVTTHGADAGIASAAGDVALTPITASPATAVATSQPTAVVSASLPTSTASAASAASATATSGYTDGTYSGTGTSRRGDVSVSVTVSGGRIANVTISKVTTQYPVSRIASLPAQVVSRQSSQVDSISGATYSAQAFRLAVQAALGRASA